MVMMYGHQLGALVWPSVIVREGTRRALDIGVMQEWVQRLRQEVNFRPTYRVLSELQIILI